VPATFFSIGSICRATSPSPPALRRATNSGPSLRDEGDRPVQGQPSRPAAPDRAASKRAVPQPTSWRCSAPAALVSQGDRMTGSRGPYRLVLRPRSSPRDTLQQPLVHALFIWINAHPGGSCAARHPELSATAPPYPSPDRSRRSAAGLPFVPLPSCSGVRATIQAVPPKEMRFSSLLDRTFRRR